MFSTNIYSELSIKDSLSKSYQLKPGDVVQILLDVNKTNTEEYRFSSGDLVEIRFLFSPDLNIEQRIRPDGKIVIPYIGDIFIADSTAEGLRVLIRNLLSSELNDPEVLVVLKETGGKQAELKAAFAGVSGRGKNFKIRSDGFLDLPFANEVYVGGLPINEAQILIDKTYLESGFNINTDLSLFSAEGSRFAIIGAVQKPGYYIIENQTNVLEAIALSGGLTDNAQNKVYLLRMTDNKIQTIKINLKSILTGHSKEHFDLLASDILFVPQTGLSKAAYVASNIGQLIFFRGASFDLGGLILR